MGLGLKEEGGVSTSPLPHYKIPIINLGLDWCNQ